MGNPLHGLIDATNLHAPSGLLEASVLAVCLVAGFLAGTRLGSWRFGVLLVLAQYSGFVFVGHTAIPVVTAAAATIAAMRIPPRSVSTTAFLLQCGFLGAGMTLYQLGRIYTESGFAPARENGLRLIDLERSLGLYIEQDVQDALTANGTLTTLLNGFYSFGFLAFVSGVVVYLFCADRKNFIVMRNVLGISAALAVVTMAIFPTAPPRLVLESGLVDTVVAEGREHNFTNEYAAVPSLHVGWMALAGVMLALSVGGPWRWAIAIVPGLAMGVTVMTTGNHYWIDGVIGSALTLGPLFALARMPALSLPDLAPVRAEFGERWSLAMSRGKARFTIAGLAGLLTYLIVGQIQAPGFTDFWYYLVFQMAATLLILVGFEVAFARQGGVSWTTHIVAVSCGYLDVFGTAGDLYAKIDEYDKLTHFMGVAAITSGAYDVFRAMYRAGSTSRVAQDRLLAALCFGGLVGIGWEIYEFLGDKVFHSTRVQGQLDTMNDLIFDFLGALTVVAILAWLERESPEAERAGQTARTDTGP